MIQFKRMQKVLSQEEGGNIYFIRHAESEDNVKLYKNISSYKEQTVNEPKITQKGQQQTKNLCTYFDLTNIRPSQIIMSPQTRSVETGNIIYQHFSLEKRSQNKPIQTVITPQVSEVSKTFHQGRNYPGNNKSFFEQNFPQFQLSLEITENGWNNTQEVENMKQAVERAKIFLNNIRNEFKNYGNSDEKLGTKSIFVVSHAFFIDICIGLMFERPRECEFVVPIPNTAVSCFRGTKQGLFNAVYINQFFHLSKKFEKLTYHLNLNLNLKVDHLNQEKQIKKQQIQNQISHIGKGLDIKARL